MASLFENHLKSLKFSQDQATTLRVIGEHRGRQDLFFKQAPEALESLKQLAMVESSKPSNRLEGITAPHKRTEDRSFMERNRSHTLNNILDK